MKHRAFTDTSPDTSGREQVSTPITTSKPLFLRPVAGDRDHCASRACGSRWSYLERLRRPSDVVISALLICSRNGAHLPHPILDSPPSPQTSSSHLNYGHGRPTVVITSRRLVRTPRTTAIVVTTDREATSYERRS